MFDLDKWQEIYITISKHKLRTALTAFGVFWGIFMLVLLLGSGKGLENGVYSMFSNLAKNSIWIWTGKTTIPYNGLKPGRQIIFNLDDYEALKRDIPELNYIAPGTSLPGDYTVNYQTKNGSFRVGGDYPDINKIRAVNILSGRFLNDNDIKDCRKVAVVGTRVVDILFGIEEPIGKYISIKGVYFQVVGVFEPISSGGDGRNDAEKIYIPLTTLHRTYNTNRVTSFAINPKDGVDATWLEQNVLAYLAQRHSVSPEDKSAIGAWNSAKEVGKFEGLFTGIQIFVWVIGIFTIIAGIVGVSNIMIIIVNERTKEIGIRKALGATPGSIVSQIITESIVITSFAGYFGLVLGIGLIETVKSALNNLPSQPPFFRNPDVDILTIFYALLILVVSGALAGFFPARKAALIKPIEALRTD